VLVFYQRAAMLRSPLVLTRIWVATAYPCFRIDRDNVRLGDVGVAVGKIVANAAARGFLQYMSRSTSGRRNRTDADAFAAGFNGHNACSATCAGKRPGTPETAVVSDVLRYLGFVEVRGDQASNQDMREEIAPSNGREPDPPLGLEIRAAVCAEVVCLHQRDPSCGRIPKSGAWSREMTRMAAKSAHDAFGARAGPA
jgi:hypothetical protein